MEGMKTGGRKLGTPNKVNSELHKLIDEYDHDPFVALLKIAINEAVDVAIRVKVNISLLPYLYSQVKSIEVPPLPPEPRKWAIEKEPVPDRNGQSKDGKGKLKELMASHSPERETPLDASTN